MKMSKVSFILPTRNVEKYIGPLLETIFSQEYDGDIEVLIMDSSDDRTPEIVKGFPIKYVWVEPDDYNFSDPEVAGVYGRQLPKEGAPPMEQFFILHTYPSESNSFSLKDGNLRKGIVFFSNTNSAIRRSVWEQIKIPEMLKSEDQEWAKRALLAGYKIVYDSEAVVYHSHKYSLKGVFHEYFDSGAVVPVIHRQEKFKYSMKYFFIDGLKFILEEYKFMLKNGYGHWIPYAIFYDLTKFFGTFLGSKQKYMPIWMKKLLCKKKNHWDKYNDVIKEGT
jgi:rhamnosyltransferase